MAQTQRRLTANELFSMIESGNSTLNATKTGVSVATQGIEEAKNKRLPDIGASLSLSYTGNVLITDRNFSHAKGASQPHFGNSFALEAQQVVYAGGAITTGIKLAELQKSVAENAVTLTRNQLRFIAIGQFLELSKLNNNSASANPPSNQSFKFNQKMHNVGFQYIMVIHSAFLWHFVRHFCGNLHC